MPGSRGCRQRWPVPGLAAQAQLQCYCLLCKARKAGGPILRASHGPHGTQCLEHCACARGQALPGLGSRLRWRGHRGLEDLCRPPSWEDIVGEVEVDCALQRQTLWQDSSMQGTMPRERFPSDKDADASRTRKSARKAMARPPPKTRPCRATARASKSARRTTAEKMAKGAAWKGDSPLLGPA